MRRTALQLFIACASIAAASAATPEDDNPFEAADRAYTNLEFAEAVSLYEQVVVGGGLSRTQLVRAYAGIGLSTAVLLKKDRAVWAFKRVLALDPAWQLPGYAGPKLAQPFEEAKAWAKERASASLRLVHEAELIAGEAAVVRVELRSDALELARSVRLTWKLGALTGVERAPIAKKLKLTVPGTSLTPGVLELAVEALDAQGSVVFEASLSTASVRAPVPRPPPRAVPPPVVAKAPPPPPPPPVVETSTPEKGKSEPLLHIYAAVFGLMPQKAVGAEVGLGVALGPYFDVGAAAVLGSNIGAQVNFTVHPSRADRLLRPFVQVRGVVAPLASGVAFGAGISVGGYLELGPGRIVGGLAAEGYAVPPGYGPYAILFFGGYQLTLL